MRCGAAAVRGGNERGTPVAERDDASTADASGASIEEHSESQRATGVGLSSTQWNPTKPLLNE